MKTKAKIGHILTGAGSILSFGVDAAEPVSVARKKMAAARWLRLKKISIRAAKAKALALPPGSPQPGVGRRAIELTAEAMAADPATAGVAHHIRYVVIPTSALGKRISVRSTHRKAGSAGG